MDSFSGPANVRAARLINPIGVWRSSQKKTKIEQFGLNEELFVGKLFEFGLIIT